MWLKKSQMYDGERFDYELQCPVLTSEEKILPEFGLCVKFCVVPETMNLQMITYYPSTLIHLQT